MGNPAFFVDYFFLIFSTYLVLFITCFLIHKKSCSAPNNSFILSTKMCRQVIDQKLITVTRAGIRQKLMITLI